MDMIVFYTNIKLFTPVWLSLFVFLWSNFSPISFIIFAAKILYDKIFEISASNGLVPASFLCLLPGAVYGV